MIEKEIASIIDYYLTSRNVYGTEDALNKMVELTTKENHLQIIDYIEDKNVKKHELDLSMYLVEIACKEYQELIPIISNKLNQYTDKDAIEDLENALLKINS
jgi:hypothetical protein